MTQSMSWTLNTKTVAPSPVGRSIIVSRRAEISSVLMPVPMPVVSASPAETLTAGESPNATHLLYG